MPDKQQQDWNADEQFWAEAWTDMKQQLDANLPPRRRKAAVWYWWLSGLILLGVVLAKALPYYFEEPIKKEEVKTPATVVEQVEVVAQSQDCLEDSQTRTATSTEAKQGASGQQQVVTIVSQENQAINIQSSVSIAAKSNAEPTANTQNEQPINIEDTEEELVAEKVLMPNEQEVGYNVLVDELPSLSYRLSNQVNVAIHPVIPSQVDEQENTKSKAFPSTTSFFVETGINQSRSPGYGAYGGIGLMRKLGKQNSLVLDVSYRYQQERISKKSTSDPALSDGQSEPVNPGPVEESGDLTLLGLTFSEKPYVETHLLRLGLSYQQKLGEKWSLSTGLGINYTMKMGLQPFPSNGGVSLSASDLNNLFSSRGEPTLVSAPNGLDVGSELDVRRWRLDGQLSVGYQLGKHWSVQAATNVYITPAFGKRFRVPAVRGQIGLRYRF